MNKLFRTRPLPGNASLGLLLLALVAGLAFALHGWGKIQHPFSWAGDAFPGILQGLAALSEFGGGIAWMLGLLTPLASLGIACTMGVAVHMHAIKLGDPFVASGPGMGAYEPAAVYFCLALLLLLAGPGRLSADRMLFGERS
jgi:putative oxidoreductase